MEKLEFMLRGGLTKRFHTVPSIKDNTVGHHSFGVACIAYVLADEMPSKPLIMAALFHDLAEQHVGDIPSPTKRAVPSLKCELDAYERELLEKVGLQYDLPDNEKRMLKLADIFDGMWNCCVERSLGNQGISVAYENFKMYAAAMNPVKIELEVYSYLSKYWEKLNGKV